MTKEECNRFWDLIVALKEGKTIQQRDDDTYIDDLNPKFYYMYEYRIKPENQEQENQNLVGKWLLSKDGNTKHKITRVKGDYITYGYGGCYTYNAVKERYTLENGESL